MNDGKKFFNDLYRDLVDRRMLVPVIALLVAIVAVPVLLKSEPPAPAPPAAAAPVEGSEEVSPAVLVSDPGVRDYSKRLSALKKKNPFIQQFAGNDSNGDAPTDTAASLSGGDTAATSTTTAGGAATVATGGSGAAPAPTTPESSPAPAPTEPSAPVSGTGSDAAAQVQQTTEIHFLAPTVDVNFGELGDAKELDGVKKFDFLPSDKNPVVAFLGLGSSEDEAVFAISNEVVETSGQGGCSPPGSAGCDLLVLKVGQQRNFKLADGTTFKLKVLGTDFKEVADPRNGSGGSESGGAEPGGDQSQ